MRLLDLGSIVVYEDNPYVFLAELDQTVYLARILSHDHTHQLVELSKKPNTNNPVALSFVILTTEEYKDRAALLQRKAEASQNFQDISTDMNIRLNQPDLEDLIEAIVRERSPMPRELVEYVKGLGLN